MDTQEIICELEHFRIHLPFSCREKATEIIDSTIEKFTQLQAALKAAEKYRGHAEAETINGIREIQNLQAEVEKYKRVAKFIAAFHTDSFKTLGDVVEASEKNTE